MPPQDWYHDTKAEALAGKLLNRCNELPTRDLHESERYKYVVDGSANIPINPKWRDPYSFRPMAGQLFACNGLFASGDGSYAFRRRNVVMPLYQLYEDKDQKLDLAETIIEKELPAIVSWMIEGAQAAITRGKIRPAPASSEEALDDWMTSSDAVRRFILEEYVGILDRENRKPGETSERFELDLMFKKWNEWAPEHVHAKMNSDKFRTRVRNVLMQLAMSPPKGFWRGEEKGMSSALRQIKMHGKRRFNDLGWVCPLREKTDDEKCRDIGLDDDLLEDLVGDV